MVLLALHGRTDRERPAASLWPDLVPVRGLANLRTTLWRIGRSAAGLFTLSGDDIGLADRVEVDVTDRSVATDDGSDGGPADGLGCVGHRSDHAIRDGCRRAPSHQGGSVVSPGSAMIKPGR